MVDTSAWFAYANRHDPDHQRIRTVLQTFPGRLITSNFIFDETVTLCLYRLGRQVAVTVGEVLRDPTVVAMLRITPDDEQHDWTLWLARPDKTYSFTDCTFFVVMRRLGLQSAIAVDTDFQREGFLLLPSPSCIDLGRESRAVLGNVAGNTATSIDCKKGENLGRCGVFSQGIATLTHYELGLSLPRGRVPFEEV